MIISCMTIIRRQKAQKNVLASVRLAKDFGILILTNDDVRGQHIAQKIGSVESALRHESAGVVSIKQGLEHIRHVKPKLIILDAEEPDIDPLQWIKQVRIILPDTPVMLITTPCDPMLASRSLRAGALAYLSSDEVDTIMGEAMAKISVNERFVSEQVMQGILHGIVETFNRESGLPIELLSDREMRVFQLLGAGKAIRTIASELGVNIKTISTHCNNIRRKLQTQDNQHLIQISREWAANRQEGSKLLSTTSF